MEFILPGRSPHVFRKQAFELRIGQTGKVVTTIAEKNPGGERRDLNQTGSSQKWLKLNGKSPPPETTMGLCGKQVGATRFELDSDNGFFSGFAARPNTRVNFSGDFHSGILMCEIKSPGSRRIGRFPD
jgi:hypothetical protein